MQLYFSSVQVEQKGQSFSTQAAQLHTRQQWMPRQDEAATSQHSQKLWVPKPNSCTTTCKALVVHVMSWCKVAYIAAQMLWEEILQPDASVVPAFVAVQITRVLQYLCYIILCHVRGCLGDRLEPAHLNWSCQRQGAIKTGRQAAEGRTDTRTDRQTDRQTDKQAGRQKVTEEDVDCCAVSGRVASQSASTVVETSGLHRSWKQPVNSHCSAFIAD